MSTVPAPSNIPSSPGTQALQHFPPVIPEDVLKPDWELLDRYQAFSSEILRLALLGITGLVYLLVVGPGKENQFHLDFSMRPHLGLIAAALVCLGGAAAAALLHRYTSSDGMACYVEYLRFPARVSSTIAQRDLRFRLSVWTLLAAAVLLGLGAAILVTTFVSLVACSR